MIVADICAMITRRVPAPWLKGRIRHPVNAFNYCFHLRFCDSVSHIFIPFLLFAVELRGVKLQR
jgi:hypothetical protein